MPLELTRLMFAPPDSTWMTQRLDWTLEPDLAWSSTNEFQNDAEQVPHRLHQNVTAFIFQREGAPPCTARYKMPQWIGSSKEHYSEVRKAIIAALSEDFPRSLEPPTVNIVDHDYHDRHIDIDVTDTGIHVMDVVKAASVWSLDGVNGFGTPRLRSMGLAPEDSVYRILDLPEDVFHGEGLTDFVDKLEDALHRRYKRCEEKWEVLDIWMLFHPEENGRARFARQADILVRRKWPRLSLPTYHFTQVMTWEKMREEILSPGRGF